MGFCSLPCFAHFVAAPLRLAINRFVASFGAFSGIWILRETLGASLLDSALGGGVASWLEPCTYGGVTAVCEFGG